MGVHVAESPWPPVERSGATGRPYAPDRAAPIVAVLAEHPTGCAHRFRWAPKGRGADYPRAPVTRVPLCQA